MTKKASKTVCEEFIEEIRELLPRLASVRDLKNVGIYRNDQAAALARRKKKCPLWFRLPGQGIVYPRESVLEFLKHQIHKSNNMPTSPNTSISHSKAPPVAQKRRDLK